MNAKKFEYIVNGMEILKWEQGFNMEILKWEQGFKSIINILANG